MRTGGRRRTHAPHLQVESLDGRLMMNDDAFSIVVWALLVSTVVAPFAFKFVLSRQLAKERPRRRA